MLPTLLLLAALADPPGYKPPVLIGIQGEGKGLRARPIAFPAKDEEWIRIRTAHFMILSSASEKRTREMAEGLETLAAALTRFEPSVVKSAPTPTRVLVFTRKKEVQSYFNYLLNREEAHAGGVYVSQASGGSMVIDLEAMAHSERTPFHELVHSLIESGAGTQLPLWLEEGLAEYFSAAELRSGSLFVGAPIRSHIETLRTSKRLIPLDQVFGVVRDSDLYNLPAGQSLFYAESWATIDSLMRIQRTAFPQFVQDLARGENINEALRTNYKLTIKDLEQNLHIVGGALFRATYGVSVTVPDVDKSMVVGRLDRADLLYELGRFLNGLSGDSGEAVRHFNAALEINPKHARALAALGRYEEAIAADPKDAEIFLTYAESLLGTALGPLAGAEEPYESDAPKYRTARELAEKALSLGGDEARARGDYGTSFIVEKDDALAPGIDALRKAHALDPSRTDFLVHLFAMLRRTGDRAESLLAQLNASRSKQVAFATRGIIVRTELAHANALAHANKLDDAASVLRNLADQTEDPTAREDLRKQAADFERVAEANRQIAMYNQAVEQVNAGKYSSARKTLDALLAKTSDPAIVRDATSLKKQLEGRHDLR